MRVVIALGVLYSFCGVATALTTSPGGSPHAYRHACRHWARLSRQGPTLVVDEQPTEDDETPEQRRARLEDLGRKAAEEASYLDSAPADDDLMKEFNAKIASEGGANMIKIKAGISDVGDTAKVTAFKAKQAGQNVADTGTGFIQGLSTQQRNIATIVFGLIAFNVVIGLVTSSLSQGSGGYSV